MKKIEIHVFSDVFFLFHLRCVMTKGAISSSSLISKKELESKLYAKALSDLHVGLVILNVI